MTRISGTITTEYRRRIDRLMWRAAIAHAGLCLAVGFNGSWLLAVLVLALAMPLAWAVCAWRPGSLVSGITMASLFMTLSALLIHQFDGLIEAHFSIFIMLSALILYCDWRVNVAGAAFIAVHHALFTLWQHQGVLTVYAVHGGVDMTPMMLIECLAMHAGAVVAQAVVLIYLSEGLRQVVADSLDITAFAQRAEKGALNSRFEGKRATRPAIAAVAGMQARLASVLRDARDSAAAVHALSTQTTQAQQQLQAQSRRSAEQIERVAASAEQLSTSTRESATEAERTNIFAAEAGDTVEQGAQGVGRLSETMGRIDASAQDIVRLLGDIDDVSFQTNLLALNASVEAARAGEQGRGFAVVAQAVRELSQRSAQTARAIRERVTRATEEVAGGVAEVTEAAERMQRVVAAFAEVCRRMNEISAASQQQHIGIETLNESMLQMQEALTISVQSIDATREVATRLTSEADTLAGAIGYFELDDDAPEPAGERRHRQRPPKIVPTEAVRQGVLPT